MRLRFRSSLAEGAPPLALALALALVMGSAPAWAGDTPEPRAPKEAITVARGSLLVYVDPKTLGLYLEPAEGRVPLELTASTLNALNKSFDGLRRERKGSVTEIDFDGRQQGVWVAIIGADGKAVPFCITELPGPVETAAKAVRAKAADRAK